MGRGGGGGLPWSLDRSNFLDFSNDPFSYGYLIKPSGEFNDIIKLNRVKYIGCAYIITNLERYSNFLGSTAYFEILFRRMNRALRTLLLARSSRNCCS